LKGYIEERAIKTAEYIIETKATVRQTARKFGVSKSTVHKDVTSRLARINPSLASFLTLTNRNDTYEVVLQPKKNIFMNTIYIRQKIFDFLIIETAII
jgi:sporulation transcriptional regulator SpoIIID